MAILNSNGVVLVTSIPTWTPTGDDATLARLQNTNTFWYWNGSAWTQFVASTVAANDGLEVSGGNVKLGDNAEGTGEPATFTAERVLNQNGFPLVHAGDDRVATGAAAAAHIREILSLESGALESFNEWIGTNANAGVGAQNNFTYYRGFNLDTTGALIDPTKHGFGEGFEFWYEPNAGEVYVEKHLVLNIAETVYRIDSHTLRISDPQNWSLYHTLGTFFIRNPADDGQYFQTTVVSPTASNLHLYGSGDAQKGITLSVDTAGTGAQIYPANYTGNEKNFIFNNWNYVTLPALTSYAYPPFGGDGKATLFQKRLLPSADNDCTLGENSLRWKSLETTEIKVTADASAADTSFEVSGTGVTTIKRKYLTTSAAATLTLSTAGTYVFTGTTTTWSLPTGAAELVGQEFRIKNRGSGNLTLDVTGGSSTIYDTSAVASLVIAAGGAQDAIWDGTYWVIL